MVRYALLVASALRFIILGFKEKDCWNLIRNGYN